MTTLYESVGQFNRVAEMLINDADNQTILDTLESIDLVIEEKAEGYARLIRNMEADSKVIAEEIKSLSEKKRINDNKIGNLKLSLETAMRETGKTKFKTPLFSFGIQKNPPSVEIIDEDLIPDEFKKMEIKIDKSAIKKAQDVPGVEIKQTESLRIR